MAGGEAIADVAFFAADELERGVALLLAGSVLLLLHRFDPLSHRQPTPRLGLIGASASMQRVRDDIRQVADLRVPVLVRGESGTGKELVARAIHDSSPRAGKPFVAINMAAIPAPLAASELFGAARGAYTGANQRRAGYFARAAGGTLFLDEIGETPVEVQALLLRALESGEIQPVGADAPVKVDVRLISATDSDLDAEITAKRFRAPLLHRLSGYVIRLAPLRERREDFGRLLVHFLRRELADVGRSDRLEVRDTPWLAAPLLARLIECPWPGNVRQLANVIRQIVIANRDADPPDSLEVIDELMGRRHEGTGPRAAARDVESEDSAEPFQSGASRRPSDISEDQLLAALRSVRFLPAAAADAL
ncbi:MAG: sigma 54-interacting transcriptional regulator, partial [Acidobacteriota bacterium]